MDMRGWRKAQGLTLRQAGAKCGVDYVSWSLIERGKRMPQLRTAEKIVAGSGGAITIGEIYATAAAGYGAGKAD